MLGRNKKNVLMKNQHVFFIFVFRLYSYFVGGEFYFTVTISGVGVAAAVSSISAFAAALISRPSKTLTSQ